MTDSTGSPIASYAYDRGTSGVTDVYNPTGIENLITTGGKGGVFTVPGFGDDWITLPGNEFPDGPMIYPHRDNTGGGYSVSITSDSTGPSVTNPGCGEVGICGGGTVECDDLSCNSMQKKDEDKKSGLQNPVRKLPTEEKCNMLKCCYDSYCGTKEALENNLDRIRGDIEELKKVKTTNTQDREDKKEAIRKLERKEGELIKGIVEYTNTISSFVSFYISDINYCNDTYGTFGGTIA